MIVVNGKFLLQKVTGTQRVAFELLKKMDEYYNHFNDKIVVVVPNREKIPENLCLKNILLIPIGNLKGSLWEHINLARFVQKNNAICFSFSGAFPLFVKRGVYYLHDIHPIQYKQYFSRRYSIYQKIIVNHVSKAKDIFVLTNSEHTKLNILRLSARKSNFGKVQKIILICVLIVTLILFLPLLMNFVTKHNFSNFGKVGYYISKMLENRSLFIFIVDQSFKSRLSGFIRNFSSFVSGNVFGSGVPIYPTGSIFSPVYDSGIFGLLFSASILSIFILSVFRIKKKKLRNYLIELFVMFIFLTFSESLATSYIAFIAGISLYLYNKVVNEF